MSNSCSRRPHRSRHHMITQAMIATLIAWIGCTGGTAVPHPLIATFGIGRYGWTIRHGHLPRGLRLDGRSAGSRNIVTTVGGCVSRRGIV